MKRVPHPHADRAERERGERPRPSAMPPAASTGVGATASTAAGTSTMPADAAGVPARLMPLRDHRVDAIGRVVARLLHVAAEGHDL